MTMQVFWNAAPCSLTVTHVSKECSVFMCRVRQSKCRNVQEPFQVHMRFKERATSDMNV